MFSSCHAEMYMSLRRYPDEPTSIGVDSYAWKLISLVMLSRDGALTGDSRNSRAANRRQPEPCPEVCNSRRGRTEPRIAPIVILSLQPVPASVPCKSFMRCEGWTRLGNRY